MLSSKYKIVYICVQSLWNNDKRCGNTVMLNPFMNDKNLCRNRNIFNMQKYVLRCVWKGLECRIHPGDWLCRNLAILFGLLEETCWFQQRQDHMLFFSALFSDVLLHSQVFVHSHSWYQMSESGDFTIDGFVDHCRVEQGVGRAAGSFCTLPWLPETGCRRK